MEVKTGAYFLQMEIMPKVDVADGRIKYVEKTLSELRSKQ